MAANEYIISFALEIIFVLGGLVVYFYGKSRRSNPVSDEDSQLHEGPLQCTPHPLDYINVEINKTIKKIASLNNEEKADQEKVDKCNFRLKMLETEKLFFTMVGMDEDKFWTVYLENFPDEFASNKTELLTDFVNKETHEIALRQIELYKREMANLEKYKQLFFQLNEKFVELDKNKDNLIEHIQNHVPEYAQDEELVRLVNKLKKDKIDLQNKLAFIEREFEKLLENALHIERSGDNNEVNDDISAMGLAERVQSITRIVTKQKLEIEELNNIIDQIQMEVEVKNVLSKKVEELHKTQKEMSNVITILEHENEFLRKQHETLIATATSGNNTDELKAELKQKNNELLELQEQYANLEAQYLKVFEKKMFS